MSTVQLTVEGRVARLHINRADKRNALSQDMWQEIANACVYLKDEVKPKVLVVSAAGDKAFSAGADISELTEIIQDQTRLKENNQVVQQAQLLLQQLPFATIAQINGVCVGGGLGIALCCDFRVAVDHARFAITPSKLGLVYSIEDTKRLVDIVGLAKAKELLYLGKGIDSATALNWGLVNEVTSAEQLTQTTENLVAQLLAVSGYSVTGVKHTLEYVTHSKEHHKSDIRAIFDNAFTSEDFQEGASAFLEKRSPEFK